MPTGVAVVALVGGLSGLNGLVGGGRVGAQDGPDAPPAPSGAQTPAAPAAEARGASTGVSASGVAEQTVQRSAKRDAQPPLGLLQATATTTGAVRAR